MNSGRNRKHNPNTKPNLNHNPDPNTVYVIDKKNSFLASFPGAVVLLLAKALYYWFLSIMLDSDDAAATWWINLYHKLASIRLALLAFWLAYMQCGWFERLQQ